MNTAEGTERRVGLNEAALAQRDQGTGVVADARLYGLLNDQVAYSRKIHYWVRFMGWALFVSITFALLAALGLFAGT